MRRTKLFDHFSSIGHYIDRPGRFFRDLSFTIRTAWERVLYGYDQTVIWDVDSWFCEIMPKILLDLKEHKSGTPADFFDRDDQSPSMIDDSDEGFKKARQRYEACLDEIIEGFNAGTRIIELGGDMSYEEWKPQEKDDWKKFHRGMILFHQHFFGFWT